MGISRQAYTENVQEYYGILSKAKIQENNLQISEMILKQPEEKNWTGKNKHIHKQIYLACLLVKIAVYFHSEVVVSKF